MPLDSIDLSRRLSRCSKARWRTIGISRSISRCGSRACTMLGSSSTRSSGPSMATGRSRKRVSSAKHHQQGDHHLRRQAVADHDAVDVAHIEAARGEVDAHGADHAHALADRDAERRMHAAAADHQHGGVLDRIARRQLGDDVAFGQQRSGAADHRRVQRAQPQRGRQPCNQPLRHRRLPRPAARWEVVWRRPRACGRRRACRLRWRRSAPPGLAPWRHPAPAARPARRPTA